MEISTFGAILSLVIAIVLIIKKVQPAYSLIAGALIGGLIGGAGLTETVDIMVNGAKGMMPAILRIITSGVLAGVLIKTGAAAKIAEQIIKILGEKHALIGLALATMVLTSVGVFVDIAVITVAPIAIALAKKAGYSTTVILFAMIGGGKAGNIISPNPNTIAAAQTFEVELSSLMMANLIPAICGLIATIIIATILSKKNVGSTVEVVETDNVEELPSFAAAIITAGSTITITSPIPKAFYCFF